MEFKVFVIVSMTVGALAEAPYKPSGWRPSGPVFRMPQTSGNSEGSGDFRPNQPELQYGPPKQTFSPPALTYRPPQQEVNTEAEGGTTTEFPTTTPNGELNNDTAVEGLQLRSGNLKEENQKGVYYIYHLTGLLQKVTYETEDDQPNKAFSAKIKYENVDPINSPVYTYDPETYVFKRLQ